MKKVFLFCMLVVLTGCNEKPISTADTENPTASAELIARVDGCNIWRVVYGGSIYFARCPHGSSSTQWEERHGKTTQKVFMLGDY